RLRRSDGRWEIERVRATGHVRVSERVDRDALSLVGIATAEIRRVRQDRIDDERPLLVVRAEAKCDDVLFSDDEPRSDLPSIAVDLLIRGRSVHDDFPIADALRQPAALVNLQPFRAAKAERDSTR